MALFRVESISSSYSPFYDEVDLGSEVWLDSMVVVAVLIIVNIPSMQVDWIPTKLADTEDDKGSYTTTITKECFHPLAIGGDDDGTIVENTTLKTKQV